MKENIDGLNLLLGLSFISIKMGFILSNQNLKMG